MSISKISLNYMPRDDFIKYQVELVLKKLSDLLLDDEILSDKDINTNLLCIELLSLKDDYDNNIFGYDENYHFDKESREVMEKSFEKFLLDCQEFLEIDLISEVTFDNICYIQEIIVEMFNFDKIIENSKLTSFCCIPVSKNESVLDFDLIGKNSRLSYQYMQDLDKKTISERTFDFHSPHNHDFTKEKSKKELAVLILKELEKIEGRLANGENLVSICRKKGEFQSENGTYVKRNLDEKIRIQLHQYGNDKIVITGIYYKESKGSKSDTDSVVQNEYENRKKILSLISADKQVTDEDFVISYQNFKAKLINYVFGDDMTEIEAVRNYMLLKSIERINSR